MHHTVDVKHTDERKTNARVEPRRRQEFLADRSAEFRHVLIPLEALVLKDNFTHQRVAVGVNPRGGQTEQYITGLHTRTCNKF